MADQPVVIECDSCGAVTSVTIIEGVEEDDVIFCPICGEEMYEYEDDDEDEDIYDDLDLDYDD